MIALPLTIPSAKDVAEQLVAYLLAVGFLVLVILYALVYGASWTLFGEGEEDG